MQTVSGQQVIRIENVKKKYRIGDNLFWALKGVNLKVERGEFVAVVGKSGSGKSTLLNLLGGIDVPTEGEILINDTPINRLSERKLSRFRGDSIGFVFQFFQLMPTLTVLENVMMPMDFSNKIPASLRKERATSLLARVGMDSQADKFPSALSGGEQQRVAIARALSNDPDIIFADEPTGNLDSNTSKEIFLLLKSLSEDNKCVIMVTHNNELADLCDRIIRICDGLIVEDTKPVSCREILI